MWLFNSLSMNTYGTQLVSFDILKCCFPITPTARRLSTFSKISTHWITILTITFIIELHTDDGELSTYQILACSAVAKTVATVTTYPHEVIRTRLQVQKTFKGPSPIPGSPQPTPRYTGILQTAALITQEEGWRGLYKGLSINLIRTVPNSAVTLLT